MLFQIPVSSGMTIVITPLVLLQNHTVERSEQVGVSCTMWDGQRMGKTRAQIVIVTPESAVSKAFSTFLNDVQGTVARCLTSVIPLWRGRPISDLRCSSREQIHASGADSVFDSHVAKAYRARVHADYED